MLCAFAVLLREQARRYPDRVIGVLSIRIVSANLTRSTELIGKMSPYLELKIGGEMVHTTEVHARGGKTPAWNEAVQEYRVERMNMEATWGVRDKDKFKVDIVGDGSCMLGEWCNQPNRNSDYPISHKGKAAGTVNITTNWTDFRPARAEESQRLLV